MALRPITRYIGQVDAADGYPYGKGRNANTYQDGTGTPFERDYINDWWGFAQALLVHAGLTPSEVPDRVGASQYLDGVLAAARRATLGRGLALRALDLNGAAPAAPTLHFIGAVGALGRRVAVAMGGVNGAFAFMDTPVAQVSGVTVPGMVAVRKFITGASGRILAIGQDGSAVGVSAFSTNGGSSWSAGGAPGFSGPSDGVWDGTRFVISNASGVSSHSTDGVSWSPPSGDAIDDVLDSGADGGLAALGTSHVIAAGTTAGTRAIAESTDHGASWSLAGTVGSTADYVVGGAVAGNGGAEVYWLGRPTAFQRLDLFVSTDGATWSKRAEIEGFTGSVRPKLYVCQDSGMLVAAQDIGTTIEVSASLDRGLSWSPVANYNLQSSDSIAVARGRVFAIIGGKLFATDGLAG